MAPSGVEVVEARRPVIVPVETGGRWPSPAKPRPVGEPVETRRPVAEPVETPPGD